MGFLLMLFLNLSILTFKSLPRLLSLIFPPLCHSIFSVAYSTRGSAHCRCTTVFMCGGNCICTSDPIIIIIIFYLPYLHNTHEFMYSRYS